MDPIDKLTDEVKSMGLDIRELIVEVRNIKEVKNDVNLLKLSVTQVVDSDKIAHKRLDSYDKKFWAVWLLCVGYVVKFVFDVVQKGG